MSTFSVRQATSPEDLKACVVVRVEVFCSEMGFPYPSPEDEQKEQLEDDASVHFLAEEKTSDGELRDVGSVRVQVPEFKLGRLVVLKRCRSHGLGAALIQAVTDWAVEEGRREEKGQATVWCFAMAYVSKLYEKVGYKSEGDLFDYAGVPHQKMIIEVKL
ncbi:acyl-CoA N-acyltransferase [Mrakia frigida]|uniref:GNAT family N-acetyltransferase n=1 Tax=Mrakia frigida TaxID=29902 RepID=UPI003FCBFED6